MQADPYLYPDRDKANMPVLVNKLNIRDHQQLTKAEYELSALREIQWRENPSAKSMDMRHLKAIHKHIFQDVYEWAGQERKVGIRKGDSEFILPADIKAMADVAAMELKAANYLRGLRKPEFVQKLAEQFQSWNHLHPFREGNGRATRVLMSDISEQAGYVFLTPALERNKSLWVRASIRSMPNGHNDLEELKALFNQVVVDSRAYHLAKTPPPVALKKHPELIGIYQDLDKKLAGTEKGSDDFKKTFQSEMKRHIYEISNGRSGFVSPTPTTVKEPTKSTVREKTLEAQR